MTVIPNESKRKAKNLQYIRMANRAEVIRFLSMQHEATRLTLAGHLGLSKMAISNIVGEMLAEDLLVEKAADDTVPSRSAEGLTLTGRKSTRIALNTQKYTAAGIYISRDELQGVIADISGEIHRVWHQPLVIKNSCEPEIIRGEFTALLFRLIDTIMADTAADRPAGKLLGIGVCCIGPLDLKQGILLAPPNFHGIEQVELQAMLSTRYQLPVLLDNDMNAAAWGEQLYGAGQSCQHVVYLGLTNGIGAGIISYGRILQGSEGFGGELGHMSIQMNGPLCTCGQRGCLELYISVPILLEKTKCPDIEALIRKSEENPAFQQSWLPDFVHALMTGLVNLANIFDPDIILIGHDGAPLAGLVLNELEEKTNQLTFQHRSKKIPVHLAKFGEKAPLIGAASLIFQAVFRGELGAESSQEAVNTRLT